MLTSPAKSNQESANSSPLKIQTEIQESLDQTAAKLKSKGVEVEPVSLSCGDYLIPAYYIIAMCEASTNLSRFDGVRYGRKDTAFTPKENSIEEFYTEFRKNLGPEVQKRILLGAFGLSSGYQDALFKKACQVRTLVLQEFEKIFSEFDLVLSPVSATTTFKRGEKSKDPVEMYLNDFFTVSANLAGIPAASFPVGQDKKGLPIGLQVMAKQKDDDLLLQFLMDFEGTRAGEKS